MDQTQQGTIETGTKDETYDIVAVLYHALQGAENCEIYAEDAEGDDELRQFFDTAFQQQRQLADQAKQLLQSRLMRENDGGSGSAFRQFGSESREGQGSSTLAQSEPVGGSTDFQGSGPNFESRQPEGTSGGEAYEESALGSSGPRNTQTTTGGGGTSSF